MATYSYYGTLQVSKYKVTILFSRCHAGDLRIFAQLLALKFFYMLFHATLRMVTLSYLYAPCIRGIIGYYYSAYIYKSPPICKAPRCNPSPACTEPNRSATLVAALAWYGLIIAYRAIFVK